MTKEEFNLALDQVLEEFGRNKFGAQRVRQGIYILEKQLTAKDEVIAEAGEMLAMRDRQLAALKTENETAWAQAHRLALELECLLLDTKDNAIVSKWWDSGMAALNEYQQLKPGAKEDAEAWAKMRKETL